MKDLERMDYNNFIHSIYFKIVEMPATNVESYVQVP